MAVQNKAGKGFPPKWKGHWVMLTRYFLSSLLSQDGSTHQPTNPMTWQHACIANWHWMAGNLKTSLSKMALHVLLLHLLTCFSDEHYKRSPNCAFFILSSEPEPAPKKTARGKAARGSKVSRASTQSVQSVSTATTDVIAVDETAEPEDSVLTTASMAQGKKPRAKKATAKAAKGGRKKTKKEVTPVDDASDAGDESEVISQPPPAKSTRGRKRGSEAVDDSMMSTASAPAAKKRATKTRASAVESSIASEDTAVPDAPAPAPSKAKGGRQSKTRKASVAISVANTSIASLRATPEAFPDDDEIERQLEADLERQLTEDEFVYEYRRPSAQPETKPTDVTTKKSAAYRMLDPEPSEADEAEVDGELQALQNEMQLDEPEKELKVAKKGRKATGTRKASKQTKAKKAKKPSPSPSPPPPPPVESIESEVEEQDDQSVISTDTVVKNVDSVDSMTEKRGRERSRRSSIASEDSVDMMTYVEQDETPIKSTRGQGAEEEQLPEPSPTPSPGPDAQLTSEAHFAADMDDDDLLAADDDMQIAEDPIEAATSPVATSVMEPPSTPGHMISPAPSAKQAALSPSQSPQSSDAENQPPSSRPSASAKRIALAPLAATPSRMSPSKRNVIAGLQSTTAWSAANLDAIFSSPKAGVDKENGVERLLKQGKELSSPEKQMTVEEWIHFNAGEAEKKLKHECERMVSLFENEGTRAMNVLGGLAVE